MKRNARYLALLSAVTVPAVMAGCAHISRAPSVSVSQAASPSPAPVASYPEVWSLYGFTPDHNAVYHSGLPGADGPVWTLPLPGAVPQGAGKDWIKRTYVNGYNVRDLVGVPIGVSVARGWVYVPDDNGRLYAVEAQTGRIGWSFDARNQIMTTPLIAGAGPARLVYVGGGNSDFSYSEAVKFGRPGQTVLRGTYVSGIYAVHADTGRLAWQYHTKGEDMPTPAYYRGRIIFGNGDGHIYALDAATGKLQWKVTIGSFVSMSSATRYKNLIIMSGTQPNAMYAVNGDSGRIEWRTQPPHVFSSSLGDCSPAQSEGILVTQYEEQMPGRHRAASVELGMDAATGRILWHTVLGSGPVPPRNKDAVPLISDGVVYTGSPVTSGAYALDLHSGRILWHTPMAKMKAAPTALGQYVFYPTGTGKIFTLDRKNGHIEHVYDTGHGGFGVQNGIIVNNSMIIGSNFGWLYSIPVSRLLGGK